MAPSSSAMSADVEIRVRAALEAGDHDRAVTETIRGLGPEILGFLHAVASNPGAADEAFSRFSIGVWRGLAKFAGRSSLRAWCYVLARRSLYRVYHEDQRYDALDTAGLGALVDQVRSETPAYLRTQPKSEIAALRAELSEEDRALLTLRVDRQLAWRELAIIFNEAEREGDEPPDDEAIDRTAAALRKRFERIKLRIRKLATERGIVPGN